MAKKQEPKVDIESMDLACLKDVDNMDVDEVRNELKRRRAIDNKSFDIFLTAGIQSGRKKRGKMSREIRAKEDEAWNMLYDELIEHLPYEFFKNRSDGIRGFCRLGAFIVALQLESSAESGDVNYGYALIEAGDKYRKFKEMCIKLQAIDFKECSRDVEEKFQEVLSSIYSAGNIGLTEAQNIKELGDDFREIFDNDDIVAVLENPDELRLIMKQG